MPTTLRGALDSTAAALAYDPGLAKIEVAADCALIGTHEVVARLDDRIVKADQPSVLGGGDAGPTPGEIALAALGACHAQTYRVWSEKLGIRIDDVAVDVRANVDIHGFFGLKEGVRPGFGEVSIAVRISGPEPPERYEKLRQAVHDHSPVLDVFMNPVPVRTSSSVRDQAARRS
jgi:uncharacterized OsmC-like protein